MKTLIIITLIISIILMMTIEYIVYKIKNFFDKRNKNEDDLEVYFYDYEFLNTDDYKCIERRDNEKESVINV